MASTRPSTPRPRRRPSACRPKDFERAYRAFVAKSNAVSSRATELTPHYDAVPTHVPRLALFRRRAPHLCARARRVVHGDRWPASSIDHHDADGRAVGSSAVSEAGWLRHAMRRRARRSTSARSASRARPSRATTASPTSSFAMQGLGSGPISLFGTDAQREAYLPPRRRRRGDRGVRAVRARRRVRRERMGTTAAPRRRRQWRLDGEKTWISNAGIADFYVVFARMPGRRREGRSAPSSSMPMRPDCR